MGWLEKHSWRYFEQFSYISQLNYICLYNPTENNPENKSNGVENITVTYDHGTYTHLLIPGFYVFSLSE